MFSGAPEWDEITPTVGSFATLQEVVRQAGNRCRLNLKPKPFRCRFLCHRTFDTTADTSQPHARRWVAWQPNKQTSSMWSSSSSLSFPLSLLLHTQWHSGWKRDWLVFISWPGRSEFFWQETKEGGSRSYRKKTNVQLFFGELTGCHRAPFLAFFTETQSHFAVTRILDYSMISSPSLLWLK